ncbi:MAG: hypothetical protein GY792_11280 [Gammaproteobacteria bacterium]|nr:hypothetical protein [Gammaproteobacteria bacterium]
MARSGQLLLSTLMLVSAGGLIYGVLSQSQTTTVDQKISATAAVTVLTGDKPIAVEEVLEPPPLSEFVEITARPLFSSSRRPVPLSTGDEAPNTIQAAVGPIEKKQFMVMGIVIAQDEKVALLKQLKKSNEVVRVKEGQKLSDWTVSAITPDSVTMQQRGVTDVVKLSDNVLSAAEKRKLAAKAKQQRLKAARKQITNKRRAKTSTNRRKSPQITQRKQPVRKSQTRRNLRPKIKMPAR